MLLTAFSPFPTMLSINLSSANAFNFFPNKPWFCRTCLQYKTFENTVGKGETVRNEQFLLFPQCFLSVWRTFFHFNQIWNCRLQTLSVWKSLKFVMWERVNLGTVKICSSGRELNFAGDSKNNKTNKSRPHIYFRYALYNRFFNSIHHTVPMFIRN